MGKSTYITIAVAVIAIGGLAFYFLNKTSQSPPPQATSISSSSGSYIEYTNSALAENKDKRRVLFFYANWCPTCRPADANFKANLSKIPEDVVVIRVNYADSDTDENEKALAREYDVTYQHTFVQIDQNGNEITKYNGGSINELLANLK